MTADLGFIHRFLPASDRDSQTTLLLLHGTGGDEQDLIPLGQELLPGAAMLSPRGKVLERGMPRFFRRFAEGVFDVEDLKFRANELAQFIEDARKEYTFAPNIIAAGYSNGANIAAGLLLLHPGLLAGGVLLRVMVPFVPEVAPDLTGTKLLLAAGRQDPIIPPSGTMQLSEILTTAGAEVTLHWHNGGHELGQDDIDVARQWLRAWKPAKIVPRP
jgi:phospholipase/carboxylesterase/glyoxalase family protein